MLQPLRQIFIGLFCSLTSIAFPQLGNSNILGQNTGNNVTLPSTSSTSLFLLIPPDARSGGTGAAGAASDPDASSVFWNPAKLAFIPDRFGFFATYTPWLRQLVPDMTLSYFSAFYKLDSTQALGASFRYFSYGASSINPATVLPLNEYAMDIDYARKLSGNWSVALTGSYLYSELSTPYPYSVFIKSLAGGVSAYYKSNTINFLSTSDTLSAGICISSIGPKIKYPFTTTPYFLPTNLRLGTSYTMHLDNFTKLSLLLDINKLLVPTPPVYALNASGNPILNSNGQPVIASGMNPDVSAAQGMIQSFYDAPGGALEEFHEITWSTGIEYTYNNSFALRAGFFYENPTKGGREYYTLGVGFKLNIVHIDAAYLIPVSDQNPLQNTLMISVGFNFPGKKASGNSTKS